MKITHKKGIKRIRISHNRKLFWIIILLLVILIMLIYAIIQNNKKQQGMIECFVDNDCVPNECCHASGCVPLENMPICEGILCTQVCSGPLDCEGGNCGCVKGKCEIISK